jgi:transcriptional regulator with XRE-family HTH domain
MASTSRTAAGQTLRAWRLRRRLSQLELASRTGVSTRHLSCLETGKANGSRQLLLYLADELDVPLRDRNELLLAAGYAPRYPHQPLDGQQLRAARTALTTLLSGHEPYPAVVMDRHWNVVERNRSAAALMTGVSAELAQPPVNVLRLSLHPHGLAPQIINLPQWSAHLIGRLHRQIAVSDDPVLVGLAREVSQYPGVGGPGSDDGGGRGSDGGGETEPGGDEIFVPLRLRHAGAELRLLNTLTTFGAPRDVTLAELVLEAFYPADPATADALRALPTPTMQKPAAKTMHASPLSREQLTRPSISSRISPLARKRFAGPRIPGRISPLPGKRFAGPSIPGRISHANHRGGPWDRHSVA